MSGFAVAPLIEVLPRYARGRAEPAPERVRQHVAINDRQLLTLKAVALAEQLRPDVVFSGHLHLSPLAAWIARRHGARLVQQAHGVEVWPRPGEMRRRSLEAAHLVLCVSRDTRARVLAWADVPPERVRVAPNTVAERFTPGARGEARQRLGLGDERVILSVSRLDAGQRHKGQDRIIRLLPALAARGLDVLYLIAGEGDDAHRLRALATETGVAERVRFLGRTPDENIADLYRAADLFALPSTGDGFGIVYLEAMACGTPALGLAVGGAPDALADGELGVLADEEDLLEALAGALAGARTTPALSEAVRARFGRGAFRARLERAFCGVFEAAA